MQGKGIFNYRNGSTDHAKHYPRLFVNISWEKGIVRQTLMSAEAFLTILVFITLTVSLCFVEKQKVYPSLVAKLLLTRDILKEKNEDLCNDSQR